MYTTSCFRLHISFHESLQIKSKIHNHLLVLLVEVDVVVVGGIDEAQVDTCVVGSGLRIEN